MSHAAATKRPASTAPLYERDLYAWAEEQARLLRAGRFEEVDRENVAEEILDVGRNEYDKPLQFGHWDMDRNWFDGNQTSISFRDTAP